MPKAEVIPTRGVAKRRLCDTSRMALLSHFPVKGSGRRAGPSPFWLWGTSTSSCAIGDGNDQKQTFLLAQSDGRIDVISLCDANEGALYR